MPATIGPYRIVRQLGEGGMGAVFEAVHQAIGRRVAIKVLHPEFASNEEVISRFFNEARAVNLVEHPGLVQISDYGQVPHGAAYIVMEYLRGETLAKRIRHAHGPLPLADVLQIGWQLADSLAAAHDQGIIHRDLKPDNVMMVPDPHMPIGERTKLLDFGIAKFAQALDRPGVRTRTNTVMGTPKFMSPEQCRGAGQVDARSDVYSLGVMLFQMITGRLPFLGDAPGDLMVMHIRDTPPPIRSLVPNLPPELAVLVDSLLAKEPLARPDMRHLAAALSRFQLAPMRKHAAVVPPAPDEPKQSTTLVAANGQSIGHARKGESARVYQALGAMLLGTALVSGSTVGLWWFIRDRPMTAGSTGATATAGKVDRAAVRPEQTGPPPTNPQPATAPRNSVQPQPPAERSLPDAPPANVTTGPAPFPSNDSASAARGELATEKKTRRPPAVPPASPPVHSDAPPTPSRERAKSPGAVSAPKNRETGKPHINIYDVD